MSFISEESVGIGASKEMETFTLDKFFGPENTQKEVYDFIGKSTIQDVITGYNGTIFAYGQTGSGKTFTMMGPDLFDEETRGVIPRAASQIFESIHQDESDTEYTLKCSMLEIYKETLRDLLKSGDSILRIKECTRKGIYVHGLNEVCITSEQDFIDVINSGEQMRTVAATRVNKNSSRSHLLLILEVRQKLPNDSEKKGILNLVDLAGSEKISHSGVTGNKLEEAKKINLSLSALGNVIHALTVNSEHVPYRDSKLTRLLQESLGGNFKTALIVACSPSSKFQDETINSLRFATRARAIRNKISLNIKNSPENYIKEIKKLKQELHSAQTQIETLKGVKTLNKSLTSKTPKTEETKTFKSSDSEEPSKKHTTVFEPDSLGNSFNCKTPFDFEFKFQDSENFYDLFCEKLSSYQKQVQVLSTENEDLKEKLKKYQRKLEKSRSSQIESQKKYHEYYESYYKSLHLINKDSSENALFKKEVESLRRQVLKLSIALQELDTRYKNFLDKHQSPEASTCLEFEETSDCYVGNNIPIVTEEDQDISQTFDLNLSKRQLEVESEVLLSNCPYANEIKSSLQNNTQLNKDLYIFQLKNQLVQAGVINANMTRALHSLDWKLSVVKHKYDMKRFLCQHQCQHIKSLEDMVDFLHDSYNNFVDLHQKEHIKPPLQKGFSKVTQTIRSANRSSTAKPNSPKTPHRALGSFVETSENPNIFSKLKAMETSLNLQKLYNTQLKQAAQDSDLQTNQYKQILEELEKEVHECQRQERERWKKFFEELCDNSQKELVRKQQEVVRLHELVADWATQFMEVQNKFLTEKKPLETKDYEKLVALVDKSKQNLKAKETLTNFNSPLKSFLGFFPELGNKIPLSGDL